MPSGRPSSVRQIAVTAAAVSGSPSPKSCRTARARSANSVTASDAAPPAIASGGTRRTSSASTPSGSRDVARTRTWPGRPTIASIADAAAGSRCSQLSTTSSSRRRRSCATTASTGGASDGSSSRRVRASCVTTCSLSTTEPSSTRCTSPANSADRRRASSIASEVLPTPPSPVNVNSRVRRNAASVSVSSRSRPISGIIRAGRLVSARRCAGTEADAGWVSSC